MSKSYLPSRESNLLVWVQDFSALVGNDPAAYGLTADQTSAVTFAIEAFVSAYDIATNRETRSPVNVEAKNNAKREMVGVIRRIVKIIQAWPEITDAKRSALGITIPDTNPTRVPAPSTTPTVSVRSVEGRLLNLQLKAPETERRGKPSNVRAAWLYTHVGEEMPTFEQMDFRGEAGRTYTQVVMPQDVPVNSKVWVSACWVSTSGKPGAVSLPVFTWTNHGQMQNNAA